MRLELIRDWETPLTTFHKGHHNETMIWARVLGISYKEFLLEWDQGKFKDWFKVIEVCTE